MGFSLTSPAPEKCDPTAKKRVWGFFGEEAETSRQNRPQTLQPRRENRPTTTKVASGRTYWPSRDPIEERGGINLYGFCLNTPVNGVDVHGNWFFERALAAIGGAIVADASVPDPTDAVAPAKAGAYLTAGIIAAVGVLAERIIIATHEATMGDNVADSTEYNNCYTGVYERPPDDPPLGKVVPTIIIGISIAEIDNKESCKASCNLVYELVMSSCYGLPRGERGVCMEEAAEGLADCLMRCNEKHQ